MFDKEPFSFDENKTLEWQSLRFDLEATLDEETLKEEKKVKVKKGHRSRKKKN